MTQNHPGAGASGAADVAQTRRDVRRDDPRARMWVAAVAVAGALAARFLARDALDDVPHVMDEIAYLLQARTFAMGRLVADVALPRGAFTMWFVDDRWARFSIFPPGWPAVLAIGVFLRAPFWVNPVLHGMTTWWVGRAAFACGGTRARTIAAAVYALSPQALILAASLMSHTLVALAGAVVVAVSVEAIRGSIRARSLVAAGAAVGITVLTRPLCACALAVALGVALVIARTPWRLAAVVTAPLAAAVVLLGAYNAALTGRAARFPQSAYFDEHVPPSDDPVFHYHPGCNDLGFGPERGCDGGIRGSHDAANALSNTGDNLRAWLLLAGGGPLAFVAAGAALVAARDRQPGTRGARRARAFLLVPAVAVIGLYALYWYAGTCYGARFYHAALPGLLTLSALGIARLRTTARVAVALAAWLAINAAVTRAARVELASMYWGTDSRFARLAASWSERPAVVMVSFAPGLAPMPRLFWTSPLIQGGKWLLSIRALGALGVNSPSLDGPVVFAKFHPALTGAIARRFPDREAWLYVVTDDPARDRLVRYDAARDAEAPSAEVPDNFDGAIVGAGAAP